MGDSPDKPLTRHNAWSSLQCADRSIIPIESMQIQRYTYIQTTGCELPSSHKIFVWRFAKAEIRESQPRGPPFFATKIALAGIQCRPCPPHHVLGFRPYHYVYHQNHPPVFAYAVHHAGLPQSPTHATIKIILAHLSAALLTFSRPDTDCNG